MDRRYQQNKELKDFSRTNRKTQTEAEKLLWYKLRNRQLVGLKFRRQYTIANYILDFYCLERRLAIELDGSQHVERKDYDTRRSTILEKSGIRVLRFWDNEVLRNIDWVLEKIYEEAVV